MTSIGSFINSIYINNSNICIEPQLWFSRLIKHKHVTKCWDFIKSIYKFYKCLNARYTHKTDSQKSGATGVALMLKTSQRSYPWIFSKWQSLFRKTQLDYYTIILVSFPLGEYADEVVDSQANYQGYRYDVHFLGCHTFAVLHSVSLRNSRAKYIGNKIPRQIQNFSESKSAKK